MTYSKVLQDRALRANFWLSDSSNSVSPGAKNRIIQVIFVPGGRSLDNHLTNQESFRILKFSPFLLCDILENVTPYAII